MPTIWNIGDAQWEWALGKLLKAFLWLDNFRVYHTFEVDWEQIKYSEAAGDRYDISPPLTSYRYDEDKSLSSS